MCLKLVFLELVTVIHCTPYKSELVTNYEIISLIIPIGWIVDYFRTSAFSFLCHWISPFLTKDPVCHLGAVVVSVLATGPKGRGFRPGRGDGFLRAIKIRSTPFFGWEVKPEVLCRNGMLKIPWDISYTSMQNSHSSFSSSYLPKMSLLVGLPESSGGRVRSYPERASSLPSLSMLTYHPADEK
jgi:hypothetical protein